MAKSKLLETKGTKDKLGVKRTDGGHSSKEILKHKKEKKEKKEKKLGKDKKRKREKESKKKPEEMVEKEEGVKGKYQNVSVTGVHSSPEKKARKSSASGVPFRRVSDDWMPKSAELLNNSYNATFGERGWGARAESVLGQVRGKDFRHEKTKKKRGGYRGGAIDTDTVHSFKFNSDSD